MEIHLNYGKGIHNDTQNFVVVLDRVFGFVASQTEAETIIDIAIPGGDIDDSGHGFCGIYPPGSKDGYFRDSLQKLSEYQAIDIKGYAEKHANRRWNAFKDQDLLVGKSALPIRFGYFKTMKRLKNKSERDFFEDMLLGDEVISCWTLEEAIREWKAAVPSANVENYRFEPRFSSLEEWNSKALMSPYLP